MKISADRLKEIIKEEVGTTLEGHYHDMGGEDEMYDAIDAAGTEHTPAQKIEAAYHDLEDVFETLESEEHRDLAAQVISRLQTLMDIMEYPEDYRE
jgi:hypothetical protein